MHTGLKIKELAEKKNLSVIKFGLLLKKSRTAIYDLYEKEHVNTKLLEEIATILEVPFSYFFEENKAEDTTIQAIKPFEINTRLKKVMHHAELNQTQFAGRIGIAQDRFSKILSTNMDFGNEKHHNPVK